MVFLSAPRRRGDQDRRCRMGRPRPWQPSSPSPRRWPRGPAPASERLSNVTGSTYVTDGGLMKTLW